jgi:hypothetical protein
MIEPAPIVRLRALLATQVHPSLEVSAKPTQYRFGEDSAAFNEIDVRAGEHFVVVVVFGGGGDPADTFITRVWHRHADEVWLVDELALTITVAPRNGATRVFDVQHTLQSVRLPDLVIPLTSVFVAGN